MKKYLAILVFALVLSLSLRAQHGATNRHSHETNEIGIGASAIYEIEHKEWATGIHAHYFRAFTSHSRWAWGGGLEYIPGEKNHIEVGFGVRFAPVEKLQISLIPGVSIIDKTRFSLHTEATYELLHFGNFHLGPVVGYAWTKDHSHISAGIHAAIAF